MRLLETLPVDLGLEEERRRRLLADLDVAFGVDHERQLPAAAGAPGPDGGRYRLVSEAPLHEGRGNRVLRSGSVDRLARRQLESVGCLLARDRERPAHPLLLVSDEKEAADLQLVQDRFHELEGKIRFLRDVLGRQSAPEPRKLRNREVPH